MSALSPTSHDAVNLMKFLAQVQQVKSKKTRDVKQYSKDGEVIWLGALATHPDLLIDIAAAPGEPFLIVGKPRDVLPREIPSLLREFVEGETNNPSQAPTFPLLGADSEPGLLRLRDEWLKAWNSWADKARRDRPVHALYKKLFSIRNAMSTKGDALELVLAAGVLSWQPTDHEPVQRHVLSAPIEIHLDLKTGEISVCLAESVVALSAEFDMLDSSALGSASVVTKVRQSLQNQDVPSFEPDFVREICAQVAFQLHPDGRISEDTRLPVPGLAPIITLSPAIIQRTRKPSDLAAVFEGIAETIVESNRVPQGLMPLVDPDAVPSSRPSDTPGALIESEGEFFGPLPLNEAQKQIIDRVDSNAQTLVQGPPGTGKTHTAAALITHLLAQGKRVLVTAETDRALLEVRGKLPEPIQDLAVSVIGHSAAEQSQLSRSIQVISKQADAFHPKHNKAAVKKREKKAASLLAERKGLYADLARAYEAAGTSCDIEGFSGTHGELIQYVDSHRGEYEWILKDSLLRACDAEQVNSPRFLAFLRALTQLDSDVDAAVIEKLAQEELPLSLHELTELKQLQETTAAQVEALRSQCPSTLRKALNNTGSLPTAQIEERLERTRHDISTLVDSQGGWHADAALEILGGIREIWEDRAAQLDRAVVKASDLVAKSRRSISFEGEAGLLLRQAKDLLAHLDGGGKTVALRPDGAAKLGMLSPGAYKRNRILLDSVRVDGVAPVERADLESFIAHGELARAVESMADIIPGIRVEHSLSDSAKIEEYRRAAASLSALIDKLQAAEKTNAFLSEHRLPPLNWLDADAVPALLAAIKLKDKRGELARIKEEHTAALEMISTTLSTVGESAAAVIEPAYAAVRDFDLDAYSEVIQALEELHAREKELVELRAEAAAFGATGRELLRTFPAMPRAQRLTTQLEYSGRLPQLAKAQAWAQLEEQRQGLISTDIDRIQQQLSFIEDRLRKQSAELAQHRAWNHAVSGDRLSPQSRAVLKSYVQQVRKLGKGTGKYAAMQRAEIRKTLDNCRASIPVWIMPLFRVTEQLAIQENMFDVVIVDEASQSSMSAVFLQYLAPKIVVIGDDKQVSPSDVGVRQDELLSLANQLIPELPFKNSWTSTGRSLFDDANMRYGGQLTLTEHRRCVPEIIGFSNAIAYENNGVPLVPVRQVTADRLSPFRLVHTPQGEMTGTATKRINDAEAHAILDHLKQCLEDPRYEGMTFGIISLLGSAQAARIEQLLLSEIDTAVIEERQIMAGIAPDFQGAERDVIFLSMVASYRGDVRFNAQTRERDVQRYNVAVSRAKEQVWVFHSVQAAELGNHEDMRFRLLDYARNTLAAADAAAQKATETIALPSEGSLTEPFDTTFEQDIYRELSQRHFRILPHYNAMGHVIDLVVEGDKARLAIECDGDSWSTREAFNAQMQAQRELERCGWHFYRIWEEDYRADPTASLERLLSAISAQNIVPQPATTVQTATTAQTPTTTRATTEPSPFSTSAPVTPSAPTAQQSAHAGHAEQAGQAEPSEEWTGKVSSEFSYEDDFYADDEFSNNPFAALIEAEAGTDSPEYSASTEHINDADDDDDNDDDTEDYPTDPLGGSLSNPFSAQPEQPAQPAPALRKAGLPNPLLVRQSNGEETQQRFPLQPSSARSELSVVLEAAEGDIPAPEKFTPFDGWTVGVSQAARSQVEAGLIDVLQAEGPIRGERLYRRYLSGYNGRMSSEVKKTLKQALRLGIQKNTILVSNPLRRRSMDDRTFYLPGQLPVLPRELGGRNLQELPAEEVITTMNLFPDAPTAAELFQLCRKYWGLGRLSDKGAVFLSDHLSLSTWSGQA
ncbi:AAA domain-containing protein [Corynebacterium flavescens]|uniref:Uncharacterized protein n=1 Tax=Corynebacterium flavescens TaxID=28028 RepID=A0A1L7CK94_CORFL|nr:AAA domain-containing protein [Corynebacterium flavescens]APT86294.1 hypothetical protein CFLV_03210 [Corynebacterium flavescens]KAA8724559.1 AAA family ATPase [Corynebacterium flavescens]GEB98290.1 hypothetical protein CFL01nite_17850 [Corynebacterium flavescens]